jgi:hypothetical protein
MIILMDCAVQEELSQSRNALITLDEGLASNRGWHRGHTPRRQSLGYHLKGPTQALPDHQHNAQIHVEVVGGMERASPKEHLGWAHYPAFFTAHA